MEKETLIAAALLLLALAPASELDRGVTRLVSELELGAVAGFSLDADVALVVIVEGKDAAEAAALQRVVGGLVRGRLAAAGLGAVLEGAAKDEVEARGLGAEWLISVSASSRTGKVRLHAELRKIDLGFWAAAPGEPLLFATADETLELEDALKPLPVTEPVPAENDPIEGVLFDGGPQRIAALPDRVLALASCEISSPFGEALFVLTRRSLHAYLYSSTGYARRAGTLELASLERSKEKTREAFGALSCASNGRELALGSSELKDGHVVRVRVQNHELTMAVVRTIAGIPVGELAPGKWATARADGGRSRLLPVIGLEGTEKNVESPLLEIAIARGRAIAVTDRYRLLRYSEDLDAPVLLGTSGVGISLIAGTPDLAVATSSSGRDRDRLRLIPLDKTKKEKRASVEIDGAVHATTVAKLTNDVRAVIAAAYRDGRTELFAIPLKIKGGGPR